MPLFWIISARKGWRRWIRPCGSQCSAQRFRAPTLANFLTDGAEQINYTAQAWSLLDLKSTVLWLMAEHMGLLGETHVYDLAARGKYAPRLVTMNILSSIAITIRSPTIQPPYVNGRLYTYTIWDGCPLG
jgi:hypothetical protein